MYSTRAIWLHWGYEVARVGAPPPAAETHASHACGVRGVRIILSLSQFFEKSEKSDFTVGTRSLLSTCALPRLLSWSWNLCVLCFWIIDCFVFLDCWYGRQCLCCLWAYTTSSSRTCSYWTLVGNPTSFCGKYVTRHRWWSKYLLIYIKFIINVYVCLILVEVLNVV